MTTLLVVRGHEHSPLTPMAARAAQPMRFDGSRFAARYAWVLLSSRCRWHSVPRLWQRSR
jgi:hypothetical protein